MKKWIAALTTLCLLLTTSICLAAEDTDFSQAKKVIENLFAALKANEVDKVADMLSPHYLSIHTDGITRDKAAEMELVKNLHMTKYELSDFHFSKSGDIIVITYKDKGIEKIDDRTIAPEAAGRMAVLQKEGDKWLIVAYANLDKLLPK